MIDEPSDIATVAPAAPTDPVEKPAPASPVPWAMLDSVQRNRLIKRRVKWRREKYSAEMKAMASYVVRLRRRCRETQHEFSARLKVARQTIVRWENAWVFPDFEYRKQLRELEQALDAAQTPEEIARLIQIDPSAQRQSLGGKKGRNRANAKVEQTQAAVENVLDQVGSE